MKSNQRPVDLLRNQKTGIKTELTYHPDWEVTDQEKYVYQFKHEKLTPLQPNQLAIDGIKLYDFDDSIVVSAFIRSTLPQDAILEVIDLGIVNDKNKIVARKDFEMDLLGVLKPNTATPWRFLFEKTDILTEAIPKTNWSLAFNLKNNVANSLPVEFDDSWNESLSDEQKVQLREIAQNLPPLKEGEVNFTGIEAKEDEDKLSITMLIRNGSNQDISIEKIPLVVEDARNQVIAEATFELNPLEIKAKTSKPWTFVYPADTLKKQGNDLSTWKAYMPK